MANPLQMLKLKPAAHQFIVEVPINAAPKKVWSTLVNPNKWFFFDPDKTKRSKHTLDLSPGGLWTGRHPSGSGTLMGTVTYYEPGKLLRVAGPLGMSHLATNNLIIFELQPSADGKTTTLRVGTRLFGFLDKDAKTRIGGAWERVLGNLKVAAEG